MVVRRSRVTKFPDFVHCLRNYFLYLSTLVALFEVRMIPTGLCLLDKPGTTFARRDGFRDVAGYGPNGGPAGSDDAHAEARSLQSGAMPGSRFDLMLCDTGVVRCLQSKEGWSRYHVNC